jgi:hypothetical protein
VKPRVELEGRDARDVQELRADGVLDLPLLAGIGQGPHGADSQERHRGEEGGEPDAQPLPGPEGPHRAGSHAIPARRVRPIRHPFPGRLTHLHALRCSEGARQSTNTAGARSSDPFAPATRG